MDPRKPGAALALSLVLATAGPATAQINGAALVGPSEPGPQAAARPNLPDFTSPAADLRPGGEPRRNGLIAAYPVAANVQVGIGRFAVPEIARPRTNVERERDPTGVRPRDRGIAAVGISLSF
ncbi:MAG TPA: hypothetical protein VF704_05760 [Allosphingosinicella sp.]|jgi:hypothetical protein